MPTFLRISRAVFCRPAHWFFTISVLTGLASTASARVKCLDVLEPRVAGTGTKKPRESLCKETKGWMGQVTSVDCGGSRLRIEVKPGDKRDVLYRLPEGPPPPGGFPVVFLFQGSYFPVEFSRSSWLQGVGLSWTPFGGLNEVRLIQTLLDEGYAVIAPRAEEHLGQSLGWLTNIPFANGDYKNSGDYLMMQQLHDLIRAGKFGSLNANSLFATGISSGGYHTSRMALSYPGMFKAVAIHSASYATCLGAACSVPSSFDSSHPPTLFLHGTLDVVVPSITAHLYHQSLKRSGVPTEMYESIGAGHEWLGVAPEQIAAWFSRWR
jgi:predicted esterase